MTAIAVSQVFFVIVIKISFVNFCLLSAWCHFLSSRSDSHSRL